MSVTTTRTSTNYSLSPVLSDYELHRSKPPSSSSGRASSEAQSITCNPVGWSTDHRRVPPHRPVNTNLDRSQRMTYNNRGEQAFINTMFFGIRVITVFHRAWRATGGRVSDRVFRYDLGGEH
ncbi:hypothetical protein ACJZ2D_001290 [Fusarium nematophilum]